MSATAGNPSTTFRVRMKIPSFCHRLVGMYIPVLFLGGFAIVALAQTPPAQIMLEDDRPCYIVKIPSFRHRLVGMYSPVLLLGGFAIVALAQTPPDQLLLKDYRPRSIFKIPETRVEKARYPVIDMHSHNYAPTEADVDRWVRTMD